MANEASKARRKARHADEKAAKAAARILAPKIIPSQREIGISLNQERVRNLPRGQWLNGKLFKNSQGSRTNRPGENILHVQAEQENHDRSVALKHTVEFHTSDPDAVIPPHSGRDRRMGHTRARH